MVAVENDVRAALQELEFGLKEDGFRLRLVAVRGREVEVALEATEQACWDCLVPDELLVEMVRGAVATVLPDVERIVLAKQYPELPEEGAESTGARLGVASAVFRSDGRAGRLISPLGETEARRRQRPVKRLDSLLGRRVALVSTGKVNADRFLAELGEGLRRAYGVAEVRVFTKPNPSVSVPEDVARELAEWADAVVAGPGDCGSCSAASVTDGILFEQLGVPSTVVITRPFLSTGEALIHARDWEPGALVAVEHPIRSLRPAELVERAGRVVEAVARSLTRGQPAASRPRGGRAGRNRRRASPFSRRQLVAALQALEYCMQQGWTDGLPVVPPEAALVDEFVRVSGRRPDEVVLRNAGLSTFCTVEIAAANAVMAGCLPEHFPVVLAGLEAVDELARERGLLQSTTGQAVLLVVNGPIRDQIGLNCTDNVLGGGVRANATIGRAVRLCLLNGLGLRPGLFDRSTQGTPAKMGLCIGENEEESPWEPFHVERGFTAEDSCVTALLIRGTMPVEHRTSRDPLHVLHNLADSMAYAGAYFQLSLAGAHLPERGGHGSVVVLGPEHAAALAEAGYSKREVRRFLWEHFGRCKRDLMRFGKPHGFEHAGEDAWVAFADSPEAVTVVVAGSSNAGISTVCPTFVPRAVTRPILWDGAGSASR
ncbi:MAG: hypothetical protein QN201_11775 [Armatimonadota bacterium]|nr:hypothetical protein [Armatimonadota bacterium]